MGLVLNSKDFVPFQIASDSGASAALRIWLRLRYMIKIMPIEASVGGAMRMRIPLCRA